MTLPLTPDSPQITDLVARLSLADKVRLLTGRDLWTTWPLEQIGLRSMVLSDGPSGVRGEVWDERSPSLNLPSATALASSWDPQIARRYGNVAAQEARRKGVDVVLGPTINLHRSPLGGRHFEAFSEDPVLTADLAAAYVVGVQENGVGATPKHYVGNDYETERFTASTEVDERTLRELYLLAFEKPVVEARPWVVMSAYNSINGVTASEHDLLETPLNTQWGFDGVVVSDWTAVRSVAAARACQDLVMPGPNGAWGDALVAAVRAGDVPLAAVDRKVGRLLLLAARVGALPGVGGPPVAVSRTEDGVAFAREAAGEGTVLLRNDGILPLRAERLRRVAVIGHNATQARTQGGGSATVLPEHTVSPLAGIRAALPDVEVTYRLGAVAQSGLAELPLAEITNPATGEPGLLVRFLDGDGQELFREGRRATSLVYLGGDAPVLDAAVVELSVGWTPGQSGPTGLGFAGLGHGRVFVDGALALDATTRVDGGADFAAAVLAPPAATTRVDVTAGEPVDVRVEFELHSRPDRLTGSFGLAVGIEPCAADPDALIADAVRAAADADVAVVVVGTNSQVESEGFDRTTLTLPGRQDDLVRAVAATGTPTVVVVNAGSPVVLPWREDVAAVLLPYFGGQEMGASLADVLLGRTEPGGRLPTTWPGTMQDTPVLDVTPRDGRLAYDEGIHIGYRAWLKAGVRPAYPFGHGLGYTCWALEDLRVEPADTSGGPLLARVTVTNTGTRPGKQVVQAYLSRPDSTVDRPVRWLAGHAVVRLPAGESAEVAVTIPGRAFAHWANGWAYEPGEYVLHVGTSVADLPLTARVTLP